MKTYTVAYRLYICDTVRYIEVQAKSKHEAYDKAVYEMIPSAEDTVPYSAWVEQVAYSTGTVHKFNTSEGNAY